MDGYSGLTIADTSRQRTAAKRQPPSSASSHFKSPTAARPAPAKRSRKRAAAPLPPGGLGMMFPPPLATAAAASTSTSTVFSPFGLFAAAAADGGTATVAAADVASGRGSRLPLPETFSQAAMAPDTFPDADRDGYGGDGGDSLTGRSAFGNLASSYDNDNDDGSSGYGNVGRDGVEDGYRVAPEEPTIPGEEFIDEGGWHRRPQLLPTPSPAKRGTTRKAADAYAEDYISTRNQIYAANSALGEAMSIDQVGMMVDVAAESASRAWLDRLGESGGRTIANLALLEWGELVLLQLCSPEPIYDSGQLMWRAVLNLLPTRQWTTRVQNPLEVMHPQLTVQKLLEYNRRCKVFPRCRSNSSREDDAKAYPFVFLTRPKVNCALIAQYSSPCVDINPQPIRATTGSFQRYPSIAAMSRDISRHTTLISCSGSGGSRNNTAGNSTSSRRNNRSSNSSSAVISSIIKPP